MLRGYPGAMVLTSLAMRGDDNNYSAMRAAAWPVLDAFVAGKPAADVHPVHITGVITTEYGVLGMGAIKGLADFQADEPHLNGAFVASAISDGLPVGATIAHEIGHTLGLQHEDGEDGNGDAVLWPGTNMAGFMTPAFGQAPILNWTAPSRVGTLSQGTVWQLLVPSKFFPRSSGFGFTGCTNDGDCQTGHPGLVCCAEQCQATCD